MSALTSSLTSGTSYDVNVTSSNATTDSSGRPVQATLTLTTTIQVGASTYVSQTQALNYGAGGSQTRTYTFTPQVTSLSSGSITVSITAPTGALLASDSTTFSVVPLGPPDGATQLSDGNYTDGTNVYDGAGKFLETYSTWLAQNAPTPVPVPTPSIPYGDTDLGGGFYTDGTNVYDSNGNWYMSYSDYQGIYGSGGGSTAPVPVAEPAPPPSNGPPLVISEVDWQDWSGNSYVQLPDGCTTDGSYVYDSSGMAIGWVTG